MFYEKKYPLTHLPNEFVTLSWERGYKDTKLFYNDRELIHIDSINKLKKGVKFFDDVLGEVRLEFSEKPISVDVIVNDFHSTINNSHPEKKIKTISGYFYLFASVAFLGYIVNLGYSSSIMERIIISIEEIFFILLYAFAGYFSKKSKIWAVYIGFISYCFITLLIILSLLLSISLYAPLITIFVLLIRSAFIFLMAPYIKMAISLKKHRNFRGNNPDILDQNILA